MTSPGHTDLTEADGRDEGRDDGRGELAGIARGCPSRLVLEQLADTWSLLVLGVLDEQPMRFNELRRAVDGISQRMLSRTLRRHTQLGFVHRRVLVDGPVQVEYSLTPLGRSLRDPVRALWQWTEDHLDEVREAEAAYADRVRSSDA